MNVEKLIEYLEKYKTMIEIVELEKVMIDSTRGKEGRSGTIKIAVPDEVIKNIRGSSEKRDLILILRIPNEIKKKMESPIIIL
jgi:hypothetical protein